jgi:hypothetical protein
MKLAVVVLLVLVVVAPMDPQGTQKPGPVLVLHHTELKMSVELKFMELVKVQNLVPEVVLVFMESAVVALLMLVMLAPMERSGTQKPGAVLVLYHTELKMSVKLKLTELAKLQELF